MFKNKRFIYFSLGTLLVVSWFFSCSYQNNKDFSEKVKVSLRDVGNQLLLKNNDATSLVLPVIEIDAYNYKVSFENELSFKPNTLVNIVKSSFKKSALPDYYRVEVVRCSDGEVGYSYQMSNKKENTIIPCAGRFLAKSCYTIKVKFLNKDSLFFSKEILIIILFFLFIIFLFKSNFTKKKKEVIIQDNNIEYREIGSFKFYPEQNKLEKEAVEIKLSKKECELLVLFTASPNMVIKRDELTKKVWEDKGVFVGRSLDTYISKLRKKLQEDTAIKLINIHGVGYKLEIK